MAGRKWGGVARRGARNVAPEERTPPPSRAKGRAGAPAKRTARKRAPDLGPPPPWEPEEWIEDPEPEVVRAEASRAVAGKARRESGLAEFAE